MISFVVVQYVDTFENQIFLNWKQAFSLLTRERKSGESTGKKTTIGGKMTICLVEFWWSFKKCEWKQGKVWRHTFPCSLKIWNKTGLHVYCILEHHDQASNHHYEFNKETTFIERNYNLHQ